MTVINTNTGSLYAQQAMNTNSRGLATVMQQLSTGKRINNAVDDVAGLAISTRLTSQIKGLNQAVRNANDAISLIQTAEGATEQVTNMLQRMRELSIQASNDTNNDKDRGFLDLEFQQLKDEIDRIGMNTQWNGKNILDGTAGKLNDGNFTFQIGANANQTITLQLPNLQSAPDPTKLTAAGGVPVNLGPFVTVASPPVMASTANIDLTDLDAAPLPGDHFVGVVVQATIAGKAVQYKITPADLEAVRLQAVPADLRGALSSPSGTTPVALTLSAIVGGRLADKLNKEYVGVVGNFVAKYNDTVVTPATTPALSVESKSVPEIGFSFDVRPIQGDLNSINPDANIRDGKSAADGLARIDAALQVINEARSKMGAVVSRLQFAADNLFNVSAKATESRSRIEDTDYSMATTELAKRNIIQQAAQAMLAQANQAPQLVLQLLK